MEPHQRSAGNRDTLAPSFSLLRMHLSRRTQSGNLEDYSSSIEVAARNYLLLDYTPLLIGRCQGARGRKSASFLISRSRVRFSARS